jgi:predicted nuclease of predicted toxin-antitoxin system
MVEFLIDEDMPRSTTTMLKAKGYEVIDVRDCALKGKSDEEIFSFAQQKGAVILTEDMGLETFCDFQSVVILESLLPISQTKYPLMG